MEMNMANMTQGQMKIRQSTLRQAYVDATKDPSKTAEEIKSLYDQYQECKAMCEAGAHKRK